MKWVARKNAAPRSAAELQAERDATVAEIGSMEAEAAEIRVALPDLLISDPEQATEAESQLTKIECELPGLRRKRDALVEGVEAAGQRERRAAYDVAKIKLDRATDRAARDFAARHDAAARAYAAILQELTDSEHEWVLVGLEGRAVGAEVPGWALFQRAIQGVRRVVTFRPHGDVTIRAFDGSVLFHG